MSSPIAHDLFLSQVRALFEETFESVKGIYLDRQTSLFETIEGLDADTASTPAVAGGTTIAGHVAHVQFYLEVMDAYMQGKDQGRIDWQQSWVTRTVDESEWSRLQQSIRDMTARVREAIETFEDFNDERHLAGALAVIVHTAYHVGAIRQILLVAES